MPLRSKSAVVAVATTLLLAAVPASAGAAAETQEEPLSPAPSVSADASQPVGTNRVIANRSGKGWPDYQLRKSTAISGDGRYVVFLSRSRHVVAEPQCHRKKFHVYLRDREAGVTTLIDTGPDGKCARRRAAVYSYPSISADGRVIAFTSYSNRTWVPGATNGHSNVFVRDMETGTTTIVSLAADGELANGDSYSPDLSADGLIIGFGSFATDLIWDLPPGPIQFDVYRHDIAAGITTLVSEASTGGFADGSSSCPSLSTHGDLIAYYTSATDIVPGGYGNGDDVVLYDAEADVTTLISRPPTGTPNHYSFLPSLSADGSTIVYESLASNLVRDDTNGVSDVFGYDVQSGTTTMISRSRTGGPTNGWSGAPEVDAIGSRVVFGSDADNLVVADGNGTSDVFVADTATRATELVSKSVTGGSGDGRSQSPSISPDGSLIAYISQAGDLTLGGRRGPWRVYAYRAW